MSSALHLVAHVAGRGFLFAVHDVDSVVDMPPVVRAPGARPAVRGLVALRSRVATVLDLRTLLNLPCDADELGTRAVVTVVGDHLYAFAVDSLEEVAEFQLETPPAALGAEWFAVTGIAEGPGETLVALNAAALVDAALQSPTALAS